MAPATASHQYSTTFSLSCDQHLVWALPCPISGQFNEHLLEKQIKRRVWNKRRKKPGKNFKWWCSSMPLSFILSLVCAWWLHIFLLYIQAVLWLLPRSAMCQNFYTSAISNISKFKIWNSLLWHSLAPDHVNYVPFIWLVLKSINLLGGSLPHFYVLFYTFATGSALSMGKIVIPKSALILSQE